MMKRVFINEKLQRKVRRTLRT